MTETFNKRIYTVSAFRRGVEELVAHMDELREARGARRVSPIFAERIMLAVTAVNGCRYCSYAHTRMALRTGVPAEDIESIAEGELGRLPPEEAVALVFAQHYAETGGKPDAEAVQRLVDAYGPDAARDILANARMIQVANLIGNTVDALLSRLRGKPAAQSSVWQELGVILGAFVFIPWAMVKRVFSRRTKQSEIAAARG
jgi:AhpD family alkylhydroperoxidase